MSDSPQSAVIVGGYALPVVGTYEGDRQLFGSDVAGMTLPELLAEKERVRRALTEASADELASFVTTADNYVKRLDSPPTVRHWLHRRDARIAHETQSRRSGEAAADTGGGPAELH
jgi:hypothetical protein